ncbi:MAG: type I-C CRISPR-associated protein Cas7/Csd2 [Candidatus Cloacimonetes bacterium]|nr:type I-C CRISPR-associated protein Cas7/Csd2 [Candidatus Cloacimonadota bacterium]
MEKQPIKNRYDFVIIFDVENGNPNGDPDAGNMPRTDPETGHGIVTDVCLKRKVRNYIELIHNDAETYKIFIKEVLNTKMKVAYDRSGIKSEKGKQKPDDIRTAQDFMCRNYYDIRTFGAVMSTGDHPCGIVRGPIQLNFAQSIDPVVPQDITITRMARTDEKRAETGETEMGKKNFIPYALYKAEGFISAKLAEKTGFSEDDLELFWEAIINMFEHDRSAARGKMIMHKLIIFKHDCALGKTHSHKLFEKVKITKKLNVVTPRSIGDYDIEIDTSMPDGVTLLMK